MIVKLKKTRLAFAHLFKPQAFEGGTGEPKFSASFLIDPKAPVIKELEAAMKDVAIAKWGPEKGPKILAQLKTQDRVCLRDGSGKSEYDGFEGMKYVAASNATKPLVVDRNKNELSSVDGKPYAGCYVNTSVEVWAQDNKYGKRINASLRGVQFDSDGDAFSGGGAASVDEFDDLGDTGDDDDIA